jgi:mRNA interferase MazF
MKRGEVYLVRKPGSDDPRRQRAFVVVSRQVLIDSNYATVICAPIYSADAGLASQVSVGIEDGLKYESAIHCDGLVSILKSALTDFVGTLREGKMQELDDALRVALSLEV